MLYYMFSHASMRHRTIFAQNENVSGLTTANTRNRVSPKNTITIYAPCIHRKSPPRACRLRIIPVLIRPFFMPKPRELNAFNIKNPSRFRSRADLGDGLINIMMRTGAARNPAFIIPSFVRGTAHIT